MSRPRYMIVWSLKHEVPPEGWPLDKTNTLKAWESDYYQQERDKAMSKKDVRQHELDRGSYAGRRKA